LSAGENRRNRRPYVRTPGRCEATFDSKEKKGIGSCDKGKKGGTLLGKEMKGMEQIFKKKSHLPKVICFFPKNEGVSRVRRREGKGESRRLEIRRNWQSG